MIVYDHLESSSPLGGQKFNKLKITMNIKKKLSILSSNLLLKMETDSGKSSERDFS